MSGTASGASDRLERGSSGDLFEIVGWRWRTFWVSSNILLLRSVELTVFYVYDVLNNTKHTKHQCHGLLFTNVPFC